MKTKNTKKEEFIIRQESRFEILDNVEEEVYDLFSSYKISIVEALGIVEIIKYKLMKEVSKELEDEDE